MKKQYLSQIKASNKEGFDGTFVLSKEVMDREGDTIIVSGINTENFLKNPIALWQHDSDRPIGSWSNLYANSIELIADIKLATTNLARMARQLIKDDVIRAVSVGISFDAKNVEIVRDAAGKIIGRTIHACELIEASLVSVPMNQDALRIAKLFSLTEDEQSIVFDTEQGSKSANPETLARAKTILGKSANLKRETKQEGVEKMTLSERIKAKRDELVKLREELSSAAETYGEEPTDENEETVKGFATMIEESQKQLSTLETAEKNIMESVREDQPVIHGKAPAIVKSIKNYDQGELIFRQATAHMMAFVKNSSIDQVMKDSYRNDRGLEAITKASVDPARTDVPAWAGDLLQEQVIGFLDLLANTSIFGAMRPRGVALMFDQYGNVKIPSRSSSSLLAGDFVGEGEPIPVGVLAITSKNVTQRNVKIISTMTREIFDGTMGQIETIIRDAVIEDTTKVMDVKLFDAVAGTAVRPAGLLSGVTPTASSGNTVDNINTDLKALLTPLMTNDAAKDIVIVMHPLRRLGLTMVTNAVGENVFKMEVNSGVLATYPLLTSSNIVPTEVHAVNARDFVSAYAGPKFETSTSATLHMEDTSPQVLGTTGTPNVVAAPIQSLFQTDTIGLRTILPLTWDMRRAAQVSSLSGVNW